MKKGFLDRLISRGETADLFKSYCELHGLEFIVREADQGESLDGERDGWPIVLRGKLLGRVLPPPGADLEAIQEQGRFLARLISHAARQENDKRVISREVLDRYREISLLYELAEKVASSLNPDEVGEMVVTKAENLFKADTISIVFQDEDSGEIKVLAATSGQGKEEGKNLEKALNRLSLGDRPRILESLAAEEGEEADAASVMYAPLKAKGKVLGAIRVVSSKPESYKAGDLKILTTLASQAAGPIERARLYGKLNHVLKTMEEVNYFNDVDTMLDKILFEARKLSNADAGSIFLIEDGELNFSYVQNDALFKDNTAKSAIYRKLTVPINDKSIVGYTALTGRSLLIDDAYSLPDGLPYSFNSSYDGMTGYRTRSILAIPLKTHKGVLVGVMQIINAMDDNGQVVPFSWESQTYLPIFANNAAVALERGVMTRERILRMMRLAELRDPNETGAHVQRVAAYSAEIYCQLAVKRNLPESEYKPFRDLLRIAAMLHDVGKVGISDTILKKPGRLTHEEFQEMKRHTIYGARLFSGAMSEMDRMCCDIALYHHERWDGGGYPGHIEDILKPGVRFGRPLRGREIPLAARIVALADVYDALGARRVYKPAWNEQDVLDYIFDQNGKQFDPEIVEAMTEVYDVIQAIKMKYQDKEG